MTAYTDYLFKFPKTGLATALQGFVALRSAGLLGGSASMPDNMLGTLRDVQGNPVSDPATAAWRGDPGTAASSYTDPDTNQQVNVPARGDPTQFYVAIRATDTPEAVAAAGINPADYGLTVCDPAESAAVLGVWA